MDAPPPINETPRANILEKLNDPLPLIVARSAGRTWVGYGRRDRSETCAAEEVGLQQRHDRGAGPSASVSSGGSIHPRRDRRTAVVPDHRIAAHRHRQSSRRARAGFAIDHHAGIDLHFGQMLATVRSAQARPATGSAEHHPPGRADRYGRETDPGSDPRGTRRHSRRPPRPFSRSTARSAGSTRSRRRSRSPSGMFGISSKPVGSGGAYLAQPIPGAGQCADLGMTPASNGVRRSTRALYERVTQLENHGRGCVFDPA